MRRLKAQRLFKILTVLAVICFIYLILQNRQDDIKDENQNFEVKTVPKKSTEHIDVKLPELNVIEQNRNNNPDLFVDVNGAKIRMVDWHDYRYIAEQAQRNGPGEHGVGFVLSAADIKSAEHQRLFQQNGFYAMVSDKIALKRSLSDIRHPECKKRLYLEKLPKVTVIIPFHNEHLSVLMRSLHSIVDRSPSSILEEIILVDDLSTKGFLKEDLENSIKSNFKEGLIKIIRLNKREGLIRTRLAGAKEAKGDVLVFFDSHIECNLNWLPPLIEPIAYDYKTVVCPFIDVINEETFAYSAQDDGARGSFDWNLNYKRLPLSSLAKQRPADPFESPVMAGGLFAISKKWFWELGGYDDGLEIWGGEQYELSFKIWQCGGRMVDAPCSRIGHIYRKFNPFGGGGGGDFLSRNHKRVAEVWMDEYKYYYYKNSSYLLNLNPGNLEKQKATRERLHCKPFKWFIENIAYDLFDYYPPVEPKPFAGGEIRSAAATSLCIDTKFKSYENTFGLDVCKSDNREANGEQKFEWTWKRDLKPKGTDRCFDVSQSMPGAQIVLFECHGLRGNQEFIYNPTSMQIKHQISGQCLEANIERKELYMNPCDTQKLKQKWKFENMDLDLINKLLSPTPNKI